MILPQVERIGGERAVLRLDPPGPLARINVGGGIARTGVERVEEIGGRAMGRTRLAEQRV
jgi:hypothetical protein